MRAIAQVLAVTLHLHLITLLCVQPYPQKNPQWPYFPFASTSVFGDLYYVRDAWRLSQSLPGSRASGI